jgi:hypothetical protein
VVELENRKQFAKAPRRDAGPVKRADVAFLHTVKHS